MDEDILSSNFEWKKKGFGKKEKLSRRIDDNQVSVAKFKKKNNFTGDLSLRAQTPVAFDAHLKKMQKKIKQALDDDDDDDENEVVFSINPADIFLDDELQANPLYKGLNDSEKNAISQKRTITQIRMQQDASKIKALTNINTLAKRAGLEPLTAAEMSMHMQNNGWEQGTFMMALQNNVTPNIKMDAENPDMQKINKLMKGLKRLQKMGDVSAVDGMKLNDVIKITDKKFNDEKVAKLLLEKTGRQIQQTEKKKSRHQPQKVSFKKLIQQKQSQKQASRELS